jgi:hypothetical protein
VFCGGFLPQKTRKTQKWNPRPGFRITPHPILPKSGLGLFALLPLAILRELLYITDLRHFSEQTNRTPL